MSDTKDGGTEDVKKTEGHTPWVTGKVNKHLIFRADEFIAECKRPEDAALIVTAVNERSALLRCEEALRKFVAEDFDPNHDDTDWFGVLIDSQAELRAALTLLDEVRK